MHQTLMNLKDRLSKETLREAVLVIPFQEVQAQAKLSYREMKTVVVYGAGRGIYATIYN